MADEPKGPTICKEHLSTPSKGRTASQLLALFSPKATPTSSMRSTVVAEGATNEEVPNRQAGVPVVCSAKSTQEGAGSEGKIMDADTDIEELAQFPGLVSPDSVTERRSSRVTGKVPASDRSLRDRAALSRSRRGSEIVEPLRSSNGSVSAMSKRASKGDMRQESKRRRSQRLSRQTDIIQSDTTESPRGPAETRVRPDTARNQIRDSIAAVTQKKRDAFYAANRKYFLPLLPEKNYVTKLGETISSEHEGTDENESTIPQHTLQQQPKGVTGTMKPYQVEGLSFLLWLFENGMSGILGDEMGLGKTLQTLSLFQLLKDNDHGGQLQARPHLVVCPLTVLNSWFAEARRWTPDLKVLKFHGPSAERNRLKTVLRPKAGRAAERKKPKVKANPGKHSIYVYSSTDDSHSESDSDEVSSTSAYDIVVTTYDTFKAEATWLKSAFAWRYVVLDEGHKIKESGTQVAQALQSLKAEFRLLLSGTPLQNNLRELWSLLHWLYPEVFTDPTKDLFRNSFDLSKGKVSTSILDDARQLLELIMLRRTKSSPGIDLGIPPKEEILLFVPLTPAQRTWYIHLISSTGAAVLEEVFRGAREKETAALTTQIDEDTLLSTLSLDKDEPTPSDEWQRSKDIVLRALTLQEEDRTVGTTYRNLMGLLVQLRKCCTHPYQLPHAKPEPYYLGDHLVRSSSKFIVLEKLVADLVINRKRKILIFSQYTQVLDFCEDLLIFMGFNSDSQYKYQRLDGGTCSAARNLGIRMFNNTESEYRIMLISTGAGGLGINLVAASDVVFLDEHWNPQVTLQAEARAHRIGQTKTVTVYKIMTQGTVEEQMLGRIRKKLYLSAKVTESMRNIHTPTGKGKSSSRLSRRSSDDNMPQLGASQLKSLIRRGTQALSRPEIEITELLSWDWATIIEKCKDKISDNLTTNPSEEGLREDETDEQKWLAVMEHVETVVFDGERLQRSRGKDPNEIARDLNREDRRIGKNTTVMVDGFAISKESMLCGDWEAVPTMAGKDPRLAEPVRKKKEVFENQGECQVCWDGGEVVLCAGCPRSYHVNCLEQASRARAKSKMTFYCPQHQCWDCERKASAAGGLIFRCRWCKHGYCEECLDWEKTTLIGDTLPEFDLLRYPANRQAFYIQCPTCTDRFTEDPVAKMYFEQQAVLYQQQHDNALANEDTTLQHLMAAKAEQGKEEDRIGEPVTPATQSLTPDAPSLTEATTVESSGVVTPQLSVPARTAGVKRKNPFEVDESSARKSKKPTMRSV